MPDHCASCTPSIEKVRKSKLASEETLYAKLSVPLDMTPVNSILVLSPSDMSPDLAEYVPEIGVEGGFVAETYV